MSAARMRLVDEPHHDGSPMYTGAVPRALDGIVRVRIRIPPVSRVDRVRVRSTPDAEPSMTEAHVDTPVSIPGGVTWWVADLPLHNPVTNYRFLLEGGAVGYAWVTQAGLSRRDVSDTCDFKISTHDPAPAWLEETVGYQIFIDRFAQSGEQRVAPPWAIPERWDAALADDPAIGTRQWFGGDLAGIEQRLGHFERVGVNLIYLTPFFPAASTHRYDASSFDAVDPLLGGDDALRSLIAAAHERGIRVIGDITLNHTGAEHDWFLTAQRDLHSPEAGFYMFGADADDYVAWHDVSSLPKLDHRSEELARRLHRGPESVIAKYLDEPFGLDGWRVDCANTAGRFGAVDLTQKVARETRATIDEHAGRNGRSAWLVAEHCFDAGSDLNGDGWQGVMAYQWLTRPLWSWLRGDRSFSLMSEIELPRLDGAAVVSSMRELGGTMPWAARCASMTMLDSHDSARFRTAVGEDQLRHVVGLVALLTMPGVPTLFAGSEVGVLGDSMDSCRVPFPWVESEWDHDLFVATAQLTSVRRASRALQHGGLRWVDATDDTITYVREVDDDVVLVHLRRDRCDAVDVRLADIISDGRCVPRVLYGRPPERVVDGDIAALRFTGGTGVSVIQLEP